MGNLVLCHDRRAVHPFEITRIHCRIYTIEELCYYLCNNLYLIDYTIMNEQLCGWLEEELGMTALLQNSGICSASEDRWRNSSLRY